VTYWTPLAPDVDSVRWDQVLERLATHSMFILIAGGLVFIAYLINRFAPQKRKRIRRAATLFLLYLAVATASAVLHVIGPHEWWEAFHVSENVLEAFTIINIVALAIFDLALPLARVEFVSLTTDIIVGVAYLAATGLVLANGPFNPSSVIGASAVASAVLALSLQSTLGNILGGVALQLDGSIHVGDWIQLDNGKQGKVKEIRWRHTAVETRDWDTIIVPNSVLLAQNLTILGKRAGQPVQHRMWVYFNVDFRYAPTTVIAAVSEALEGAPIPNVAADPKPNVICYDFAKDGRDSFGYYAVRYWLTDLAVDDPTSSAVRARVFAALKRAHIPLARPTSTVFYGANESDEEQTRLDRQKERRMHALESIDLFKELTHEEIAFLAAHARYAPFTAGEIMTRQGAVAHWLYIMTTGRAEVRVCIQGEAPRTIATLVAPAFFGEMGLMTGEPRANDVVAITDVECYRLDKEGFQKIVVDRPSLAHVFSETLATRRVELLAARDGLDADAKRSKRATEQARILERIQNFFGLSS
jgi:small-conductance mechanosensitive channel/CRP-like cAMP-binding protein